MLCQSLPLCSLFPLPPKHAFTLSSSGASGEALQTQKPAIKKKLPTACSAKHVCEHVLDSHGASGSLCLFPRRSYCRHGDKQWGVTFWGRTNGVWSCGFGFSVIRGWCDRPIMQLSPLLEITAVSWTLPAKAECCCGSLKGCLDPSSHPAVRWVRSWQCSCLGEEGLCSTRLAFTRQTGSVEGALCALKQRFCLLFDLRAAA